MDALLRWLAEHPRALGLGVLALSLAALTVLFDPAGGRLRLTVDPSLERLLPEDDDQRAAFERLTRSFGDPDYLLLAVQLPAVFSPEGLAAVEAATRAIRAVPGVRDVVSLATAPNLLAEDDLIDVSSFSRQAQDDPDSIARMPRQVADNPLYAGSLVTADGRLAALLVTLEGVDERRFRDEDYPGRLRAAAAVDGVEQVWLTGAAVVRAATTDALLQALVRILPVIFIIILLLLALAFRCLKATLATALTIALGLLWTGALLVLLDLPLNMVTAIVPPLILTLGLSYAVHLLAEFFAPHGDPTSPAGRLRILRRASTPLLLCGATTAAGFAALGLSPLPAIRQFALLSAVGVLITIALVLSFLPAALGWLRCGRQAMTLDLRWSQALARRLAAVSVRHRGLILGVAAAVMVAAAGFATQIRSGAEYIRNFAPDSAVRLDFETLNARFGGATLVTIYLETFVNDALTQPELIREIDELQRWLKDQPEVGAAVSYVDHLKVLHQSLNEGDPAYFRVPDSAAAVKQILVFGGSETLRRVVDASLRSAVISVRLNIDDSRALADFIQRTEARLAALPRPLTASLTGLPVMATRTVEVLAAGQWQSLLVALAVIGLLLALLFNSVRGALLALVPNAACILTYFGLLGLSGIGLNPTTSLIACIVLGVAVDDTIQFMARFNHDARASGSELKAVESALSHTLRPVTLTSLALVTGFLAFATSELHNQVQFGLLAAFTLAAAWLINLTVTPALGSKLRVVTLWDLLRLDLGQNPQHTIPLFSGLSLRQARLFALTARMERLAPGARLIEEGDIARDMYVIVEGRLEAWVERSGQRKLLASMSRGAVVGETGYFGQRRTAHVEAMTPARVLRFNSQDLEQLRRRYPQIAAILFRNLNRIQAERIARMTALVK